MKVAPGRFSVEGKPVDLSVTRILNATRLAVLGILLTVGLGAAALAPPGWWRLLVGLGSVAATCALFKAPRTKHRLTSFIAWVTDF